MGDEPRETGQDRVSEEEQDRFSENPQEGGTSQGRRSASRGRPPAGEGLDVEAPGES